jgi:hypothetical protein
MTNWLVKTGDEKMFWISGEYEEESGKCFNGLMVNHFSRFT